MVKDEASIKSVLWTTNKRNLFAYLILIIFFSVKTSMAMKQNMNISHTLNSTTGNHISFSSFGVSVGPTDELHITTSEVIKATKDFLEPILEKEYNHLNFDTVNLRLIDYDSSSFILDNDNIVHEDTKKRHRERLSLRGSEASNYLHGTFLDSLIVGKLLFNVSSNDLLPSPTEVDIFLDTVFSSENMDIFKGLLVQCLFLDNSTHTDLNIDVTFEMKRDVINESHYIFDNSFNNDEDLVDNDDETDANENITLENLSTESASRIATCRTSKLSLGSRMYPGNVLCSPNKKYHFTMNKNSELSIWENEKLVWSAGIINRDASSTYLEMGTNGNMVVNSPGGILWETSTVGDECEVIIGDDGVVTVTNKKGNHLWSSATYHNPIYDATSRVANQNLIVDATTLDNKIMAGYQGWFFAKDDGGYSQWVHWGQRGVIPDPDSVTIDMWPDLRELDPDELFPTSFQYGDGSNAGLYSAYNTKTVERHCRWMKEYGVDGVFVQRFINSVKKRKDVRDRVLDSVRSGSEKFGRVFANMYDISNGQSSTVVQEIIDDWKHLVDNLKITESDRYLRHRGRPVLAIWGFGFEDRIGEPKDVARLIDWLKNEAPEKYRVTLMGGVPTNWRSLTRDSKSDEAWASIYRSFDIISPWAVGRYREEKGADHFRNNYLEPDLKELSLTDIDYLPVVYPGFSAHNNNPDKPFNEMSRQGGTFYWRQLFHALDTGNKMVYVAMFDEVDEASAIFKLAENSQQTPTKGKFLTLDADPGYPNIPNDWYLRLTGFASRALKQNGKLPLLLPDTNECKKNAKVGIWHSPGDFICSDNERIRLGLSPTHGLSLWQNSLRIWSSGTKCDPDGRISWKLKRGGRIVIKNEKKRCWTSARRNGRPQGMPVLVVGNNSVGKVIDDAGNTIWSTIQ